MAAGGCHRGTEAMKLKGRIAIVTGAAMGIGRAIGLAFRNEGARTAFVDINADELGRIARNHSGSSHEFLTIAADATQAADVERAVQETARYFGGIDILVNNVGGAVGNGGISGSEADWDATFALCFKSQFLFCRAVLPAMRSRGGGR